MRLFSVLFFTLLLTACGGSEPEGPSGANVASINLGSDMVVAEGQVIAITAVVYPTEGATTWTQIEGPAIEDFPTDAALELSVLAPQVDVDTDIVIEVVYVAPDGQRVDDQVTITVKNIPRNPVAVIDNTSSAVAPYKTFELITLSGKNSYDTDGEVRAYQWRQIDTNIPLQFFSATDGDTVTIQAPYVEALTHFQIELTVIDNFELIGTNIITIPVAAAAGTVSPDAGQDQTVNEFSLVKLDASNSFSVDNVISCTWTQISGISVDLINADQCIAEFYAPNVDITEALSFQVEAIDGNGNSSTDTVNVTVNPLNLGTLHDTGVVDCYDDDGLIPCDNVDYPNQDADSGSDSVANAIDKYGAGEKTFDFTKFDVNGDELSNDALVFSCVRDNFTGLVWEVKESNASPQYSALRGVENYYSIVDEANPVGSCPSAYVCSVEAYIEAVNDQAFCGGANWRLPTYIELMGIMDYGDTDQNSLLPNEFFPYAPDRSALNHMFYWVSDINVEGGGELFNWVLDVSNGDDSAIKSSSSAYVRLVRRP